MKDLKYLIIAFVGILFASCMGKDYADPEYNGEPPYGNNEINETNVVTISKLKEMFKKEIDTDYRDGTSYRECIEDVQIKGIVTGNDIGGNIYNEIALQDSTGAIIIAIAQSGINGYLPIGTEIIVNVKNLYVGNYGKQAVIGTPYTNKNGATYVSRMNRMLWNNHFKITGNKTKPEPELFANGGEPTKWNLNNDGGKLGIIKNVTFRDLTPLSVYADPNGKVSVSWYFNEYPGNDIMIYTSPYCKFANKKLPAGRVDITGIIKRFNDKWEIIIRSEDDVVEVK